jgi:hypothetical protein
MKNEISYKRNINDLNKELNGKVDFAFNNDVKGHEQWSEVLDLIPKYKHNKIKGKILSLIQVKIRFKREEAVDH